MPPSSGLGFVNETSRRATRPPTVAAVPDRADTTTPSIELPANRLVAWNLAMFAFHSILAVTTLAAGKTDLKVDTYRTAIDFRRRNGTGWDLIPRYVASGHLYFTLLTALFFVLSASFHLMNATLLRDVYLRNLAQCYTPSRWIEYTLSAPIMLLLIAYTMGVRERFLLLSIVGLTAVTMPFGYWVETVARPLSPSEWTLPLRRRLTPWVVGHLPQVAAWGIIVAQYYTARGDATESPPPWVDVILWVELLLFFSFGVASVVAQYAAPKQFYKGEILFQILSFVSKGLLGILLLSNVLMLSRFEEIYE